MTTGVAAMGEYGLKHDVGEGALSPLDPRSLPRGFLYCSSQQEHGALQDGQYGCPLCSCLTLFYGGMKASGMCIHGVETSPCYSF